MQLSGLLRQKRQQLRLQVFWDSIKISYFFFIKRNLKYTTSAEGNYAVFSSGSGRQKTGK